MTAPLETAAKQKEIRTYVVREAKGSNHDVRKNDISTFARTSYNKFIKKGIRTFTYTFRRVTYVYQEKSICKNSSMIKRSFAEHCLRKARQINLAFVDIIV